MTKRLILTRHAKSSWDDPAAADHGRPLNGRGRSAADDLGGWLASRGYVPDEVICSDATRTAETWARLAPALPAAPAPRYEHKLYQAPSDVMLAILRHAHGDCVMMIGHNPGIAEFAHRLVAHPPHHDGWFKYPTAATLVVDFDIDSWSAVTAGTGDARDFVVPREIGD